MRLASGAVFAIMPAMEREAIDTSSAAACAEHTSQVAAASQDPQVPQAPQTSQTSRAPQTRNGVLAGIFCYVLWGFMPLYWKLLSEVNSLEVICHRIIWCFVLTAAICAITRHDFVSLLKTPRARRILVPSALLITLNWSIYIYAVDIDHIVETAIGYYINPLVSILLGIVFFRERLSALQSVAVCLCAVGIAFFTVSYGSFPWIAIALALTFGIYGAVKKKGGYPAIEALAVENAIVVIPAVLGAVALAFATGSHGFLGDVTTAHGWAITALLVGAGVATAVPLILFAKAANSIPLSLLGFIQYVSPTIALLVGVFANGEPFTFAHAVCFGCIWSGLALVAIDSLRHAKK